MKKIIALFIVLTMAAAIFAGAAIMASDRAGDTNGDGEVDNKDVVSLFRFVSGNKDAAIEEKCDYNGDGSIDNKDVVALFRDLSAGIEPGSDEDTTTEEDTTEELGEFIVTPDSEATLTIPRVIADHMVIQRDQEIKIWGSSNRDGALVRGQFMGDEALGKVKGGKWEITFSPKAATFDPQDLTVEDSCGNKIEFTDILVGDVWLIGGQSNAEATSKDIPECYSQLEFGADKPIRIFHQGALFVIENPDLAKEPSDDIINPAWKWGKANRQNVSGFSLLGWFFGDKLAATTNVPIGVVSIAASGASMSELMPKELTEKFSYTKAFGAGVNHYYNALTHPFLNMKFKGLVFCQGESEAFPGANPPPHNYARDFEALMTELRARWGFDFPIYNIQLTDYTEQSTQSTLNGEYNGGYVPNVGIVRAQQYDAYKNMDGVRLVASYDLGADEGYNRSGGFLHSPYKKELGERVADLVLADIYGIGSLEAQLPPEPVEVKVVSTENGEKTINIKFKNVGEGLVATDGGDTVTGFLSSRSDTPSPTYIKETTGKIISADTVQIVVPGTAKAVNVGYACMANIKKTSVKLVNSYGMPVLAFYLPATY